MYILYHEYPVLLCANGPRYVQKSREMSRKWEVISIVVAQMLDQLFSATSW